MKKEEWKHEQWPDGKRRTTREWMDKSIADVEPLAGGKAMLKAWREG